MKGLALLLGKGPPLKGGAPMPDDDNEAEAAPDSEQPDGDESQYAKLVIDALKDGDDEGAASALVELVRCCTK